MNIFQHISRNRSLILLPNWTSSVITAHMNGAPILIRITITWQWWEGASYYIVDSCNTCDWRYAFSLQIGHNTIVWWRIQHPPDIDNSTQSMTKIMFTIYSTINYLHSFSHWFSLFKLHIESLHSKFTINLHGFPLFNVSFYLHIIESCQI